jgi:hypothetical protein
MGTQLKNGDQFISSREKAQNRYGQNGAQNASSDLPGQKTTSGFLPAGQVPTEDWQTRKVDATPIAPAHGMSGPKAASTIPANGRPVTRKA